MNKIAGNLYMVATPIGNLEDITLRAIRILKEVDLILCEDTRETGKLLRAHQIENKLMSYHAQSKLGKIDEIIEMLKEGKNLALVSDAGTPAISDPGSLLVKKILEDKILEDRPQVKVLAVPGPCALTSAFSISGVTGGEFVFLGFLPHKKGRETLFREIGGADRAYVFYESPHRIMKTLEALEKFAPTRKVFVGRELTKMYEESIKGSPAEILTYFREKPDKVRGEFVVITS